MTDAGRRWLWPLAAALLAAGLLAAGAALVLLLAPEWPAIATFALMAVAASAAAALPLRRRFSDAPAQLLEQVQIRLAANEPRGAVAASGSVSGSARQRALAAAVDELVQQRDRLRVDVAQQVADASRSVEQERSRLAALMAELQQSVVVCNLDGLVLLCNQHARQQFSGDLIGLGRSIHLLFEPALLAHALDQIRQRMARGAAHPAAQFVAYTRGGQLLRAQMAPVRDAARLGGYVLLLDDITEEQERDAAQDRLLLALTEGSRASLGNQQAALEVLDDPTLEPAARERFLAVVRDETRAMAARINALATSSSEALKTRWPLQDMLGADLVAAALGRIESATTVRTGTLEIDTTLWLKVDSFALLQALAWLAHRLVDEFEVRAVLLRLQPAGVRAQLDLVWTGQAMSTETVMTWESQAMQGGASASPLSVRDVMQRHGGEFWFERDRVRHLAFFRFLLPLADAGHDGAAAADSADSRPEFYDFDLFQRSDGQHQLDDQPLAGLTCTVFDTETTGLDPAAGDEIIQIGALRIVNGRLLRQDSFDQLVDPQRSIPAAGIAIHGIRPEQVAGKPTIVQVLPEFHRWVQGTVLVAHNAAFDLRFLQLKEAVSGVCFDQPVLDTLLLSAVLHPNQEGHTLEAIAERLAVPVTGRHTALGDAGVTAEVFLKMLPLLAAQGIHTLGQARAAAQQTWLARVRY